MHHLVDRWAGLTVVVTFGFQTRQPVFVKLLQGAYRVTHCSWLQGAQKQQVENCIKTLADIGSRQLVNFVSHLLSSFCMKSLTENLTCDMAWLCAHVVTQCYVLTAKTRGIAIPSDLEHLVTKLFSQQHILIKSSRMWLRTKRESSCSVLNHDYKTIIEGLQVRVRAAVLP